MASNKSLLAILAALSLGANVRADEPAWQKEALATIEKGLAWLAANEVEGKGVWGDPMFPAITGLALWSFANSGDPQYKPQIDRAVAFLLSCVNEDGGIYVVNPNRRGGGLGNYNTSICLTALHAARGADPAILSVLLKARDFIAASQLIGDPEDEHYGGFGYDRASERVHTDLTNTHFSLDAMRRTQGLEDLRTTSQPRADVDWQAALAYVSRLQNTEGEGAGGFFYNPTDAKAGVTVTEDGKVRLNSYGSISYNGFLSLIFCEVKRDDPRIVSVVDYASRHWTLDENPGLDQGSLYFYFNVMSRSLAAANMDAIPRKDGGAPIAWGEELVKRLTTLQKEDGSWSNTDNRWWESDPSLVTSYALLALQFATGAK